MDESQNLSRLEQLLEETLELAEENNRLLHQIQRTARWSFWGKLLLWILVLGLPFFFLGPILKSIVPVVPSGEDGSKSVFGLPSAEQLKAVLDAYHATSTGR